MEAPRVALLGFGEVGHVLAAGLAGRVPLRVYDPAYPPGGPMDGPMGGPMDGETRLPDACELVACNADAVRMADLVIAVTTGADSLTACEQSRPHLAPGTLYADLSTGAPGDKRRLAELLEPAGAAVVDGAIMAPIPLRGLATPILASGPEAGRFAAVAGGLGMSVTPIGGSPGDAAAGSCCAACWSRA
jgi:hypothetical protein